MKPDIFLTSLLSDIRVGELGPRRAAELEDFLKSAGFERTITPRTKLSVVYELLEKKKEPM